MRAASLRPGTRPLSKGSRGFPDLPGPRPFGHATCRLPCPQLRSISPPAPAWPSKRRAPHSSHVLRAGPLMRVQALHAHSPRPWRSCVRCFCCPCCFSRFPAPGDTESSPACACSRLRLLKKRWRPFFARGGVRSRVLDRAKGFGRTDATCVGDGRGGGSASAVTAAAAAASPAAPAAPADGATENGGCSDPTRRIWPSTSLAACSCGCGCGCGCSCGCASARSCACWKLSKRSSFTCTAASIRVTFASSATWSACAGGAWSHEPASTAGWWWRSDRSAHTRRSSCCCSSIRPR